MRMFILAALAAATVAAPAFAQEDPNLPGVRVTITPRSYLDPGNKVPPRTTRDISVSPLNTTFGSPNYSGVEGFQSFPLPDQFYLPDSRGQYVLRAPDRIK